MIGLTRYIPVSGLRMGFYLTIAPAVIHTEDSLLRRIVRDFLSEPEDVLVIQGDEAYDAAVNYFKQMYGRAPKKQLALYNDAAVRVAEEVVGTEGARGVLICGSGQGVCMQANRFRGVRAINGLTPELAEVGRRHNDANVLCLAADFVLDLEGVLRAFFETGFDGGEKYVRRNKKLDEEVG